MKNRFYKDMSTANLITCNRVPLKHINTVFTSVLVKELRGRCSIPEVESDFRKKLYASIKEKGVLDPLLVWFLTGIPIGPKSGFLVRVGSSRLQICNESPELEIKELPCFVLNYQGNYKPSSRNKGFFQPLVEGELINSKEKALSYCHNKEIVLRFSTGGWLTYAVANKFEKIHESY